MFIQILLYIFKLGLLIEITHSFKTPKHDLIFYYKTQSNVFLTNPKNHTTSYGIYVAGLTIYIDIPTSVVGVWDIVNWKVVNVDKDRLMFVHNKKAQILIDQKTIKEMKFSGELSDSIIAFGDNEALHVPTILNPDLTKPNRAWNYIELLYFNVKSESVSVIQRLPWLKDDDWKFIKEWKMTDYIHFDDKLYLAIRRSIWNEISKNVTQEISIIRLCLDKGSELISSAIEFRLARLNYNYIQVNEVILILFSRPRTEENEQKSLYLFTTQYTYNQTVTFLYYYLGHLVTYFDYTAKSCASGGNVTLLQYHLRSEVGKCKETTYERCSTKENIVPSADIDSAVLELNTVWSFKNLTRFFKPQYFSVPYPYYYNVVFFHLKPIAFSFFRVISSYYSNSILHYEYKNFTYNNENFDIDTQLDSHINKHPLGGFYVTKESNKILEFWNPNLCEELTTCTHCLMYGLSIDCFWSNSMCTRDDQPKNKTAVTVNYCFKIINISPAIFNASVSTPLTIELDRPLNLTDSQETLIIKAGPYNYCTNITMNGTVIKCFMMLNTSGEFNILVDLISDKYSDVSSIGAVSADKVDISAPEIGYASNAKNNTFAIIIILFLGLLSSLLLVAYTKCDNQQLDNRLKAFSGSKKATEFVGNQRALTPVEPQISSSKMNTQTESKKSSSKLFKSSKLKPTGKLSKSLKSVKSVKSLSRQSYLSQQFPLLKSKSMVNRNMK